MKMASDRVMKKALNQHRTWRDICERGSKCVVTPASRRGPIVMGGKTYPGVYCDVCGVGREAAP